MKATVLIAACFFFLLHATAQDTASTGLDPVTVTAGFSPVQASKTGRNLVVLKGEQFYQLPVNSIDELLRYIPGVEVQARGPMGTQSDIVIRGGTFQQVLVILDGIRLNDPLTGHFSSYIPIAPMEIDHIEVLKGASSAIYGTEAVGGVIHIITKSFANQRKTQAIAQASFGEYGLFNVSAGATLATKNGMFAGGIQSNHAEGQPQRGTTGFFDITTASLSYRHDINEKWHVAARTSYDYRDFSAQNFYTTFVSDTARERVKTWWNHVHTGYKGSKWSWWLDAGYKTVDDRFAFNTAGKPNENKSDIFQLQSVADVHLGERSSLVTGVQYLNKGIVSNDRGNHNVWQSGVFAIWKQEVGKYIHLEPAIRFDYNDRGGFELVPQLNASYRRSIYQLRGSVGRTIRDADFTERFNNYNRPLVTSGSIGNPDLVAETSWSYEAGADLWLGKHWKLASTFFSRDQQNLIDFVPTPYADMPRQVNLVPNGRYALAKNIASVVTQGFETDIVYRRVFNQRFTLLANAGLLWLDSDDAEGGEPGFYISSHANFMTNYGVQLQAGRFVFSVNGLYKTREPRSAPAINAEITPSYFVMNVKVEGRIVKGLGVFVQADNVFDEQYSDLLGSVMPGRWLMGGIKWQFTKQ
jgi:iron complex outermembrane receptor protein